ncbi:MAG: riboflavin biosynthesis protein RibF [Candidatus Omnitrophota bacterium]
MGIRKRYLAIGVFDGVHKGHQKVIRTLISEARKNGARACALTFDPHPLRVVCPGRAPLMLISLKHRIKVLRRSGISRIFVMKFDKRLARVKARDFVEKILIGRFKVKGIVVGEGFRLGRGREGTVPALRDMARTHGLYFRTVPNMRRNNEIISSTAIRRLVTEGKLREASSMLGRPYSVLGTVVHGRKQGRIMGFPTANLDLHHEAIPPSGVYAVKVLIGETMHNGILNIGFRPTFGKNAAEKTVEAHIFGFKKRIYGKDAEVFFIRKQRAERRFGDKDLLRDQIRRDADSARRILKRLITGVSRAV